MIWVTLALVVAITVSLIHEPPTRCCRLMRKPVSLVDVSVHRTVTVVPARVAKGLVGADGNVPPVVIVIVTVADPCSDPESVARAVMVCVPATRSVRVNVAPVPIVPCRLDDQVMLALRLPSWVSLAVPVNVISVPTVNEPPLPGELMATVGAVLVPPPPLPAIAAAMSTTPPVTQRPESDDTGLAVDRILLRTCAYVSVGFAAVTRATAPATCGHAIDVPLRYEYPLVP